MTVIEASDLIKTYLVYDSPRHRFWEMISFGRKKYHRPFSALAGISFNILQGQSVGIIGQNGSGKSTLLKIICGVLQQTSGRIRVSGRIASLLELGAGFNPEFTGRENVYMNGALTGLSKEEIDQRFAEVESFAEIGSFIDQPVKTYSSGMFVRLAFSAAVSIDPDILVIDEALSVGDIFFQHKCISKMESFKKEGKTILLVAHDLNLIRTFCDSAMLLNRGNLLAKGDPEYVTEQYMLLVRQMQTEHAANMFRVVQKQGNAKHNAMIHFGAEAGHILEVVTRNKDRDATHIFLAGAPIFIAVKIQVSPLVEKPAVTLLLRDERGYNIYGTDTTSNALDIQLDEMNQATISFAISPILKPGSYSLTAALHYAYTSKTNMLLDKQVGVSPFMIIENGYRFLGVIDLQATVSQARSDSLNKT